MKTFFCTCLLALVSSTALAIPNRPVMVGGSEEFDACGGYGIATATTTLFTLGTDGFLKFDKIEASQGVYSCDSEEDGEYVGIVFGAKGQNCGVGSPIKDRKAYEGACKSGWIKKAFFELLAG